jgi:hypothetical protein
MIARFGPLHFDSSALPPYPESERPRSREIYQRAVLRCLESGTGLRDWSLIREGTRHLAYSLESPGDTKEGMAP